MIGEIETVVRGAMSAVAEDFATGVLVMEIQRAGDRWSMSLAIPDGAVATVSLDVRTAQALIDALATLQEPDGDEE